MELSPEEIQERFIKFLTAFSIPDENGIPIFRYQNELKKIAFNDEMSSLVIDFEDLAFEDPDLAELIHEDPQGIIKILEETLKNRLRDINPNIKEERLNRIRLRLKNVGRPVKIRELFSSNLIDRLVRFYGIIVKATKVKHILRRAKFQCMKCGTIFTQEFEFEFEKPKQCPNPHCDNTSKFKLIRDTMEFEEYQELTVQELPEELPPGQLPQGIVVILRGDMTGKVRPGDRVKIYGIVRVFPDTRLSEGKKPLFDTYIEALYVESELTEIGELKLTEEDKRRILELKDDPELEKKIYQSIAPAIYGQEIIKKAIAALLFGGVRKEYPDGTKVRGDIHILLIGDPGIGKSQMLKYVAQIAPRGIYATGKGTTTAGLTAAVVKTQDGWALEAGVLVLADKGIACLHPDSRVLVDGRYVRIEDLFNMKKAYKAISKGEIIDILEEEHDVVTLNLENMRVENSRAAIIRRKLWNKELLKIRFQSGNEIILTPDHLLIDGKTLKWKAAANFKEGDFVIAPLKLPSVKRKIYILDILPTDWRVKLSKEEKDELKREILKRFNSLAEFNKHYGISKDFLSGKSSITVGKFRKILRDLGIYEKWKNRTLIYGPYSRREKLNVSYITPELTYFLGFVYGDGWIQRIGKKVRICITQSEANKRQIERLYQFFKTFYPDKLKKYRRITKSYISGKNVQSKNIILYVNSPLLAFLYEYITSNALANAFKLDDEALKGFIAGVLDSDGCISIKHSSKGVVAHAEFLISNDLKQDRAFALLLRRFDVYARVIEGSSVNKIIITGREDVKNLIKAVEKYSVKVKDIPTRKHLVSASSDKVPAEPIKHLAEKIIQIVPSTVLQRKGIWSVIYAYAKGKYLPSRDQLKKVLRLLGDYIPAEISTKLNILISRDYFLDKIVSIKRISYQGYVYDIYVPSNHNFVAEGIVVHNCIDEFDKMKSEDRRALHEAMEQQTVSIAKAGIVATLNARASILAAANPKFGRYLINRDIADNIDLPPSLLSRFDLIFIMIDEPDAERDLAEAEYILGLHAREIKPTPPISIDLFRKYIQYAREHVFPKLTPEASRKLKEFYMKMRLVGKTEKEEAVGMTPIAITKRQLEALVRLAEAHARMLLKDKVDESDAEFAIELMRESLRQVARDPLTGEIDVTTITTGRSTSRRGKYMAVLDLIRELQEEYPDGVPIRKLIEVAREKNISEEFVYDVVNKELRKGTLYQPKPGRYKLVPGF